MDAVDFVRCPKCHSRNWQDIPAVKEGDPIRFGCSRCQHVIRLGACAECHAKQWVRLPDIPEKRGRKPICRFQCAGCERVLGIIMG